MRNTHLDRLKKEMADDDVFAKSVKEAQQRAALKEYITGKETVIRPSVKWARYLLLAAAMILLTLGVKWWLDKSEKDAQETARLARIPIAQIITDKYLKENLQRNTAKGAINQVDIATLYNDLGDFDKIIALLEPKGINRTPEETAYLAKSYAQKQQFDKVVEHLKTFNFSTYDYGTDVQWLYALALIKINKKPEAIAQLKMIKQNPQSIPYYKTVSTALLQELEVQ